MNQLNQPAMPSEFQFAGLSKREAAAIALRVPMSGDPELDAMILEARRMDAAEAALRGISSNEAAEYLNCKETIAWANQLAAALIASNEAALISAREAKV